MANLSITAASVAFGATPAFGDGIAGETITAGMAVYQDSTDSYKLKKAQNSTAAKAEVVGIALHAALSGQPLRIQTDGDITIGATTTAGAVYVASATAGLIAPVTDLPASGFVGLIGMGVNTTTIRMIAAAAKLKGLPSIANLYDFDGA